MDIKNRILKTELVKWRELVPLQPKNFKELSTDNYNKLKQSIINNNFVMSFTVWDSGKELFIIDGVHRYKVLDLLENEGFNIPDKLPCTFIDCKDKKEASKLVLIYSSIYAKTQDEGLYEFLNEQGLNFEDMKLEIDIPNIDLEKFELGYYKENDSEVLNDVPEVSDKAISKTGDLFLIDGKHRVLCGDSTKKEDVEKLMDGKKADCVVSDPPYNTGMDGKENAKARLSHMFNDKITDWFGFLNSVFGNFVSVTKGECVFYVFIDWRKMQDVKGCMEKLMNVKNVIVWDKQVHGLGSDYKFTYEMCVVGKKGSPKINNRIGLDYQDIWRVQRQMGRNEDHATAKPIQLLIKPILHASKGDDIILDLFLGSGSTLIASEQTNRVCYGMEIDPIYIDVILKRYKKLYPESKFECLNRKFDFNLLFNE